MADMSKMSDDELRAIVAGKTLAARDMSKMSDDELRSIAYRQPEPPVGVTIHRGNGVSEVYKGGGKYEPTTMPESRARAVRDVNGRMSDIAEAPLRGIPYAGAFVPRAAAGIKSFMQGTPYADELTAEQAKAKTYDADYPIESTAGQVAGGLVSTLLGAQYLPAAGMLLGVGAKTLPGAIARGGVAGALQGAAQGAGNTEDLTSGKAMTDAGKGMAFGGALGSSIPAALGVAGQGINRMVGNAGDMLSSAAAPTVRYLRENMMDPAKLAVQKRLAAALGPEGMLADVGQEWKGIAQGASARPGSREIVVDPLKARDADKSARMLGTVTTELGGDVIPSEVKKQVRAAQDALSPEYTAVFANAKAVDMKPLADKLGALAVDKRGPTQKAAEDVLGMLYVKGTKELDPNPKTLHEIRKEIDGMMGVEPNRAVKTVLAEARKAIDEELAAKVPGIKPIDAKYAAASRELDAFKTGQKAFDTGRENVVRPSELAGQQSSFAQPAGTAPGPPTSAGIDRLSEGARSEIHRLLGTNSNDVAKLNNLLKGEGDWNRDKLRLLFGQNKADKVLSVLDAERQMEGTFREVVGGSQTGVKTGFNAYLDKIASGRTIPTDTTATGAISRGVQNTVNMFSKGQGEATAERVAKELARLSVATGASRDDIIDALMKRGVRANRLEQLYSATGGASGTLSPLAQALSGSYADPRSRQSK